MRPCRAHLDGGTLFEVSAEDQEVNLSRISDSSGTYCGDWGVHILLESLAEEVPRFSSIRNPMNC